MKCLSVCALTLLAQPLAAQAWDVRVEAPFPMDLLVWRLAEQRKTDSFTRGILTEGKVMYEASDAASSVIPVASPPGRMRDKP